uniref:Senescence domain-containing protein n=1 Tax=Nelumbo nucifera TaxID=4432 RepID=A0A822ZL33_NELNU|nr:TPA_asm: hypothetical protein HUJ06_016721 [Nelumbo nucifera]
MDSQNPGNKNSSFYPQVIESNPETASPFVSNPKSSSSSSSSSMYPVIDSSDRLKDSKPSSSSSLYPSIDMNDLVDNLFPDKDDVAHSHTASAPIQSFEEVLIKISGAIVHLIDRQYSVELACGDLTIVRLRQGESVVAVLVRVDNDIQWPLAKDEAVVRLDESHYFFTLRLPADEGCDSGHGETKAGDGSENLINYGLTFASKGQENLLKELDGILEHYSNFSVQKVSGKGKSEVLDGSVAEGISPSELKSEEKKEMMEERSAAYWTTLAPNVEDYSGSVARAIAVGSGQLIWGILWCGDVTVDRLKWGNEFLKKRMEPGSNAEISPEAMKRIQRFAFNVLNYCLFI